MHAFTRFAPKVLGAAAALLLTAGAASAQTLGTFSFALAPYCNNAVMVVTQEGSTYRLAGWDDNCGAVQRYPITGTIAFNLDGTLNISFTTIRTNGIGVDTSIRNFSLGSYQGAWTDSAGNSGTSGIVGLSAPTQNLGARPGPSSTVPANSINTTNIIDNSIAAVDVDSSQVQLRVSGTCPAGQAVRSIAANGTVTCGAAGSPTVMHTELGIGGTFSSCTDLATLNFGTVPAGTLTCDASVHALFDHVTATTSRLEFDVQTVAAGCGDANVAVFEMPGTFPSVTGHDVSVPVHRSFTVAAGPLTAYLNGRALFIASASRQAVNLTCTFTPQ